MKLLFVLAAVFVVAHAVSLEEQWQEFKLKHGKAYKSLMEEKRRFAVFQDNVRLIEEHNVKYAKGEETWAMGVNKFADMTQEEFRATLSPMLPKPAGLSRGIYNDTKIVGDANIDYVKGGLVTPVKDQGQCGSCWAFSTVGGIEGQVAKSTGKLISLSTQELVDCDKVNAGCNGGLMDDAFKYVMQNGISTMEEYPYIGYDEVCKKSGSDGQKISGFKDVAKSEAALGSALETVGPISIAFDANFFLQLYSHGIFNPLICSKDVNHGVLLVGAGSANGEDYWLIKNSWGASWGENGYFRAIRGKEICGITEMASYPTL